MERPGAQALFPCTKTSPNIISLSSCTNGNRLHIGEGSLEMEKYPVHGGIYLTTHLSCLKQQHKWGLYGLPTTFLLEPKSKSIGYITFESWTRKKLCLPGADGCTLMWETGNSGTLTGLSGMTGTLTTPVSCCRMEQRNRIWLFTNYDNNISMRTVLHPIKKVHDILIHCFSKYQCHKRKYLISWPFRWCNLETTNFL